MAGLAITLAALAVYSAYTIAQIRTLRHLQSETVDRNRTDSLLLLRIQNDLNSLSLTMRDMLDASEPYPLTAWAAPLKRMQRDLEDALRREAQAAPVDRTADQRRYLASSMSQFWDAVDRLMAQAAQGNDAEARVQVRVSLQARQAALSAAVARLLIQNNESEERAVSRTQQIYSRVERNAVAFLIAMMLLIVATTLVLVRFVRQLFQELAELSNRRRELAQQLISAQEDTYRHISRELHDEFGQILTAVGAMLARLERRAGESVDDIRHGLHEVREIAQSTLEKVRTLSQSLHPVMLDEAGLESTLEWYLAAFQKQTGVKVEYGIERGGGTLPSGIAIQVYRVLQEALNNVARHSGSPQAWVRLHVRLDEVLLEVEDAGRGLTSTSSTRGMGMTAMRERAELVSGRIEFLTAAAGGVLVRLRVPLVRELTPRITEAHAG